MRIARTLSRLYRAYNNALVKHPVQMQCVQTAILCATGDLIAQMGIEEKKFSNIDKRRLAVFTGYGGLFVGPLLQLWYEFLESRIKGSHYVIVAKKIFLDQLLLTPTLLCVTLTVLNAGTGKNLTEIKERFKSHYMQILLKSWQVWPAVQFINFSFVPLNFQVPIVQIVGIGWNTYLSWKANKTPEKAD